MTGLALAVAIVLAANLVGYLAERLWGFDDDQVTRIAYAVAVGGLCAVLLP